MKMQPALEQAWTSAALSCKATWKVGLPALVGVAGHSDKSFAA
jgi:hypothetical protein